MTDAIYDSPESNVDLNQPILPAKVSKPWYLYLMAVWVVFGIGSYASVIVKSIARDNQEVIQFGTLGLLAFTITLLVFVLKMNRNALIVFGASSALIASWQMVNIISTLLSGDLGNPVIFLMLYYAVPSIILSALSLRPKLLNLALEHKRFKDHESMKKASLKAMRR